MRILKAAALTCSVLLIVGSMSLTGCSPANGCGVGSATPDAAVSGFLNAVQTAKKPHDVCQWVTPGMTISADQLSTLKATYSGYQISKLTLNDQEQMGNMTAVTVTSTDGKINALYPLESDDHSKWTISYGTVDPGQGPTPASTVG